MKVKFKTMIGVAVVLLLSSCSISKLREIQNGKIVTPGIEISSENGSFTLKSNETWNVPFPANKKVFSKLDKAGRDKQLLMQYDYALKKLGAKKVIVKVSSYEYKLYGVLLFNKTDETCNSPSARSYRINIPEKNIQAAKDGGVSVCYEYYTGCGKATARTTAKTWILWLSDVPF